MNTHVLLSAYATCLTLDSVPRIGYDVHLSPFPGALYAILEYRGDRQDYAYLMGITGAAFRRLWKRDDGGNVGLLKFGDTPFSLAFAALGYPWHKVPTEKATMIAAIEASLARDMPPISFGLLGPPEAGLVTGYADAGAVLYGWSYFQPDGSRYYEKRDWFETLDTSGGAVLIVLGEKKATKPTPHEVLVTSLEWALDLAYTSHRPDLPEHVSGLAAYPAWANALEVDADYPANKPSVMDIRTMVYGDQCVMLEERREAARFLRQMKAVAPREANQLEATARLYDKVADWGTMLWPWPIEPKAGAQQGLADRQTRRALADYVRAAGEQENQAVASLEKVWLAVR